MGSLNDVNVKDLLSRYLRGECTEAEKALVERWYLDFNEEEVDISEQRITELGQKIFGALSNDTDVRTKKLWSWRGAVAAAVFASLLGVVWWMRPFEPKVFQKKEQVAVLKKDSVPAGKSVLKLSDGTMINITDAANGVLLKQKGLEVVKTGKQKIKYKITGPVEQSDAAALNTISTPGGAQMEISLSDDTKVWLNAATTLIFPIVFAEEKRRTISLSGEAYFEVFKDKTHPFVVSARNQMIEVLGTHFNITAYRDDASVRTTLLEGSVKVSSLSGQGSVESSVVLKPNEQAVFKNGKMAVQTVDPEDVISWKNGEFVFRDETLEDIMLKMGHWYNVDIVFQDQKAAQQLFGGSISRQTSLSEFLRMLETTGDVHFQVKGKKVIVSK